MTAVVVGDPPRRVMRRTGHVVRALAWAEAVRMLRNPVLWIGAGLSGWAMWSVVPEPGEWPGASYESMSTTSAPLLLTISIVTAITFHRERADVAAEAPVGEATRATARLLASLPLVALGAVFAALMAWREGHIGGLWLGMEPGRTTEALHTSGELAQHVALALLAVAVGAALGRRMPRLVSVVPLLFVLWFLVSIYWLFAASAVTPFSIIQVQPVRLEAGPADADALSFPAHWLLEAPGEYSEVWARVVVSASLAWWHVMYLVGLSFLWAAVALPRGAVRPVLITAGSALAAIGVVTQYLVIP